MLSAQLIGEGLVSELTLKEIKGFDAGGGEKIPTLEEALDFLDKKVKVFVELKETGIEKQVLSIVHEKGLEKNVVIVSFLEDALKKVRELDKDIETGLIYAKHKNPLKAALELESKLSSWHSTGSRIQLMLRKRMKTV